MKKNFSITQNKSRINKQTLLLEYNNTKINFERWRYLYRPKEINFCQSLLLQRDSLVDDLYQASIYLTIMNKQSMKTTIGIINSCYKLFEFLDFKYSLGELINSVELITKKTIEELINWLSRRPSRTDSGLLNIASARGIYTRIKSLLMVFVNQGKISKDIFPYAPFPNANRMSLGVKPYTKSEFSRLAQFIWGKILLIKNNEFKGSYNQILAIYALMLSIKTGRNTSTILNLDIDCIQPHPLSPDTHVILTSYKRRGSNTHIQAMKRSYDISNSMESNKSVLTLINELIELTSHLRDRVSSKKIFITTKGNTITLMNESTLLTSIKSIQKKSNLFDDTGKILDITISKIRKTFANKIWSITGGDPIKTAKIMGNTIPVLNTNYLEPTPEMERKFKYFGKVLVDTLDENFDEETLKKKLKSLLNINETQAKNILIGKFNTATARCKNPFDLNIIESENEPCKKFIHCFQCPNQVILESDLYRLFSFYWTILEEKNFIGNKKWQDYYSWVIETIEKEIEPLFKIKTVKMEKERARVDRHPMWQKNRLGD